MSLRYHKNLVNHKCFFCLVSRKTVSTSGDILDRNGSVAMGYKKFVTYAVSPSLRQGGCYCYCIQYTVAATLPSVSIRLREHYEIDFFSLARVLVIMNWSSGYWNYLKHEFYKYETRNKKYGTWWLWLGKKFYDLLIEIEPLNNIKSENHNTQPLLLDFCETFAKY